MAQGHTCMSRELIQSQSSPNRDSIMQQYTDRNSLRPAGLAMNIQCQRHTARLFESLSLLTKVHWVLASCEVVCYFLIRKEEEGKIK